MLQSLIGGHYKSGVSDNDRLACFRPGCCLFVLRAVVVGHGDMGFDTETGDACCGHGGMDYPSMACGAGVGMGREHQAVVNKPRVGECWDGARPIRALFTSQVRI